MAFNQARVKSASLGAKTTFVAPLTAFGGSLVALTALTSASAPASSAGLVIAVAGPQWNIEWDSLVALVETDITTSTLTVASRWQGSWDGTNWIDMVLPGGVPAGTVTVAAVQYAAAGTGSLITKQYFHPFQGVNPGVDYLRIAFTVGVTTGAAGDNVTASYGFRKRMNTSA